MDDATEAAWKKRTFPGPKSEDPGLTSTWKGTGSPRRLRRSESRGIGPFNDSASKETAWRPLRSVCRWARTPVSC